MAFHRIACLVAYGCVSAAFCNGSFAAPTIVVTKGGTYANNYLDANGNWVWNVQIINSEPASDGSISLTTELGISATSSPLIGAVNLSTGPGDDFDTIVSAPAVFGWELPGSGGNAEGLQTNCASGCTVTGNANQIFAALRSVPYDTTGPRDFIQIVTQGPGVLTRTTGLTVSGVYAGGGRISELDENGSVVSYDMFNNLFSRTAGPGDVNLDGKSDLADLNIILQNWNRFFTVWHQGDLISDGVVELADLGILLQNYNTTYSIEGQSGFSASAVPEPTTCALVLNGAFAIAVLRRRQR